MCPSSPVQLLHSNQTNHVVANTLLDTPPQLVQIRQALTSPGVKCPLIEQARQFRLFADFKHLSDLQERSLSLEERERVFEQAYRMSLDALRMHTDCAISQIKQVEFMRVQSLVENLYIWEPELLDAPPELSQAKWRTHNTSPERAATVDYIERTWKLLVKRTPSQSTGSLICLPYPIIIPGSRFQESYYWDSYFAIQGLIRTGRWELAAMQVENFLFMIDQYGLVPNGSRDYYLTRSQPPFLACMIRDVIEHGLKQGHSAQRFAMWLRDRAYPLVQKDYFEFWMNPNTRWNAETQLNNHWDDLNLEREERHGADEETELALTFRDVRAEAESGKDFSVAFEGRATRILPVCLNSILFKVEKDLAWMASFIRTELGNASLEIEEQAFEAASRRRLEAINRYLWDEQAGTFKDYNLDRKGRVEVVTADMFGPLWAGYATTEQAEQVVRHLSRIEFDGGIAASECRSGKQWDLPYGWAPHQYFVMFGLQAYGFAEEAKRIARKWTGTIDTIHAELGVILEKIDVVRAASPLEIGNKYETQSGFLWTNAVYLWAILEILGEELIPIN